MCGEGKEMMKRCDESSSTLYISQGEMQTHRIYGGNHIRSTPPKKEIRFFVENWENPVMVENMEKNLHSVFRHDNMLVVVDTATVRIPCGNHIVVYECVFVDGKVDYIDAEKEDDGGTIWEPV